MLTIDLFKFLFKKKMTSSEKYELDNWINNKSEEGNGKVEQNDAQGYRFWGFSFYISDYLTCNFSRVYNNIVRRNYFMVRGRLRVCLERLRFYCTTHPFQAFAVSNIGLLEWVGCLPSVSTYYVPGSSLISGLSVLFTQE